MTQPPDYRVIVSSGGPFHAYHLARGAQAAGYLKRFLTTVFDGTRAGLDVLGLTVIALVAAGYRLVKRARGRADERPS